MLTRDELKAYLQIAGASRDGRLDLIVASVNERIPTLTKNDWQLKARTEKRRGNGTPDLVLRYVPVVSITRLAVGGEDLAADAYELDEERGILTLEEGVFAHNAKIVVEYEAGRNGWPADLKGAAVEIAAYVYHSQGGVQSDKGLAGGKTLFDGAVEQLPTVAGTLESHTSRRAFYL